MRLLKRSAAGAALVVILTASSAAAQGVEASPRQSGVARLSTEPGAVVTAVFRLVGNWTASPIETRVQLPPGWHVALSQNDSAGTRHNPIRLLPLRVPRQAEAGTYVVRYSVRWPGNSVEWATDSVLVQVGVSRHIAVELFHAPKWVVAGQTYTSTFRVSNHGNVQTQVRLLLASSNSLPVRLESDQVELDPGADQLIRVTVRTSADEDRPRPHRLYLRATAAGDTAIEAKTQSSVDVVPQGGRGPSLHHSVPVELSLHQTGHDGTAWARSAELRASGTLGVRSDSRLDLLVRTPGTNDFLLGQRDQYTLSVATRRYTLRLGDNAYALSPLTETGQMRFGGEASVKMGPLVALGFAHRDRWRQNPDSAVQRGGSLQLRRGVDNHIAVNYQEWGGTDSRRMYSVRSVIADPRFGKVDVEYGISPSGNVKKRDALAISLSGRLPRSHFVLTHRGSGAGFSGPLNGSAYDYADLTINAWSRLSLRGAYQAAAIAPPNQSPAMGLRRSHGYDGTVSYASLFAVRYAVQHRSDLPFRSYLPLGTSGAAVQEALRVSAGMALGPVRIQPMAELGTVTESGSGATRSFRRYRLESFVSTRKDVVSVFVERYEGGGLFGAAADTGVSAGMYASSTSWNNTSARLSWSGTKPQTPGASSFSTSELVIEQRLPFGHSLILRARKFLFGAINTSSQSALEFTYRIRFGVPVSPSIDGARVEGRVFDVETGKPLANTIVRIGDHVAVTDSRGRVLISGLAPKRQYMEVDLETLGAGRVTMLQNPFPVLPREGATARVEVSVVRSAQLSGRVQRFERQSALPGTEVGDSVAAAGGMGSVVMTLSRGDETRKAATGSDGGFSFGDLRPGIWLLRMLPGALPEHHVIERDTITIELRPGDSPQVAFRVLPRQRVVLLLEQGEITLRGSDTSAIARTRSGKDAPSASIPLATTRPPATRHTYTVTKWDTGLPYVAFVMYGDSALWPKIWVANRHQMKTPRSLRAGQRLLVPESAPLTAGETAARDEFVANSPAPLGPSSPVTIHRYTVTRWDIGLKDIAGKVYGDALLWPKIWLANQGRLKNPEELPVGMRLVVPESGPLTPDEQEARNDYMRRFGREPR